MSPGFRTLSDQMAAGRLPAVEALRYASQVSEALDPLHAAGRAYGGLTPESVLLTSTGVELSSEAPSSCGNIDRFTAPECLQGQPPDCRSDIFALGAIVYEIAEGRPAFPEANSAGADAEIVRCPPPSLGASELDRLVTNCLAENPADRWRLQQVQMELKLLSLKAHRTAANTLRRQNEAKSIAAEQHRELTANLENLTARLEALDTTLTSQSDAIDGIRSDVARIAAEQTSALHSLETRLDAALAGMAAATRQDIDELVADLAVHETDIKAILTEITRTGASAAQDNEATRSELRTFKDNTASVVQNIDATLKGHGHVIESIGEAMADNNNLVEQALKEQVAGLKSVSETVAGFRVSIDAMDSHIAEAGERADRTELAVLRAQEAASLEIAGVQANLNNRIQAVDASVTGLGAQIGQWNDFLAEVGQRAAHAETVAAQAMEAIRSELAGLQAILTGQIQAVDQTVKTQETTIKSVKGEVTLTSSYVEQLVEAVESIQAMVLDRSVDTPA